MRIVDGSGDGPPMSAGKRGMAASDSEVTSPKRKDGKGKGKGGKQEIKKVVEPVVETPKSLAYEPYDLKAYKEMSVPAKLGGLGANIGSEDHQARKEKADKMKDFARAAAERNKQRLAQAPKAPPPPTDPTVLFKPTEPTKVDKMKEFSKNVPKPKIRSPKEQPAEEEVLVVKRGGGGAVYYKGPAVGGGGGVAYGDSVSPSPQMNTHAAAGYGGYGSPPGYVAVDLAVRTYGGIDVNTHVSSAAATASAVPPPASSAYDAKLAQNQKDREDVEEIRRLMGL